MIYLCFLCAYVVISFLKLLSYFSIVYLFIFKCSTQLNVVIADDFASAYKPKQAVFFVLSCSSFNLVNPGSDCYCPSIGFQ